MSFLGRTRSNCNRLHFLRHEGSRFGYNQERKHSQIVGKNSIVCRLTVYSKNLKLCTGFALRAQGTHMTRFRVVCMSACTKRDAVILRISIALFSAVTEVGHKR